MGIKKYIKNTNISKRYIQVSIIIFLIIIIGLVGTYAWFTWSSTNNTSVTLSIGELADVTYTTGPDIKVENLSPVYNYTDGESTTFSITNKDTSGSTLRYTVSIDITKIDSPLISNDFKYKLVSGTNVISEGDFSTAVEGGSINLTTSMLTSAKTNFTLYFYIDGNDKNSSSMMNQSFIGKLNVNVTKDDKALITLTNLGLSVDTSHTPDFTTVSGNSGVKKNNNGSTLATGLGDSTNGVYAAEDDLGTSYYFRGDVQNNYVYFANNWFRIIRINGDGTIRMIYTGNPNDSSSQEYISKSAYNSSYNDNAYVGYMYGSAGSSTYNATHANTNDSTIKKVVDTWYQNNLSSYSQYIADAIYCNDREVVNVTYNNGTNTTTYNGNGTETNNSAYASLKRNNIEHNPTLKCTNNNDKFTVSNTLGNGALTNPIGLPTTDEIVMSGANAYDLNTKSYITNNSYYLYPKGGNYYYWTMTPNKFAGVHASVDYVYIDGRVDYSLVDYSDFAARPVVTLLSNAISGGDGTVGNPFYVGSAPSS